MSTPEAAKRRREIAPPRKWWVVKQRSQAAGSPSRAFGGASKRFGKCCEGFDRDLTDRAAEPGYALEGRNVPTLDFGEYWDLVSKAALS